MVDVHYQLVLEEGRDRVASTLAWQGSRVSGGSRVALGGSRVSGGMQRTCRD